jgi:glycosyltransferase involved in cell wall biosynthesis
MVDYYARVVGVRRDKIRLLYNDVDVRRFAASEAVRAAAKAALLQRHGYPADSLVLLLVHRLSPVRRTERYFPACIAALRDGGALDRAVVFVAGSGDELPRIQARAQAEGVADRIVFLGAVPNREIERLYAAADVFLHPTYTEGFPRVILEAMAAGLPIVTTDAGGTRELLGTAQQGYVTSREDPAAFAAKLRELVGRPDARAALRAENLEHVRRFSTEQVARMYEEVLFA